MEALADKYIYTNKDQSETCTLWNNVLSAGDHIPQHCYILHNHPYISSSNTLIFCTVAIFTVTCVGMVACVKCSNVVECALLQRANFTTKSLFVYFVRNYHAT